MKVDAVIQERTQRRFFCTKKGSRGNGGDAEQDK
jgi:hypothetical protein